MVVGVGVVVVMVMVVMMVVVVMVVVVVVMIGVMASPQDLVSPHWLSAKQLHPESIGEVLEGCGHLQLILTRVGGPATPKQSLQLTSP